MRCFVNTADSVLQTAHARRSLAITIALLPPARATGYFNTSTFGKLHDEAAKCLARSAARLALVPYVPATQARRHYRSSVTRWGSSVATELSTAHSDSPVQILCMQSWGGPELLDLERGSPICPRTELHAGSLPPIVTRGTAITAGCSIPIRWIESFSASLPTQPFRLPVIQKHPHSFRCFDKDSAQLEISAALILLSCCSNLPMRRC